MKNLRNNDLADRRANAADAKKTLLDVFRAAKAEPTRLARQAERVSLAEAREARRAERDRLRLEERIRLEATAAEEKATAVAETEARATAEAARIARLVGDEAERKAERDRRYAARKARQA